MNRYKICGEYTIIYLDSEKYGVHEALIDTEDLEKLLKINRTWGYQAKRKGVRLSKRVNGENTSLYLHRVILNAPANYQVDHINGDWLDNRKANLRLCSIPENGQNRVRLSSANKSGFRGVSWSKEKQKYRASIMIDKQSVYLGYSSSIEEAVKLAKYARAYLMPFSEEYNNIPQEEIPIALQHKLNKYKKRS